MSGLPRTVIKWLQGLDLTFPFTNPKWDFSNGFLVAEIFSKYFPKDVQAFSYSTGNSLQSKMGNWSLLKKFIVKNNLDLSMELVDGTLHCKEGAALLLIESLYQVLTKRQVQKAAPNYEIDLTDWPYQQQLPFHARSTAVQAIRNNIKNTEIQTDPNMHLNKQKAESIILNQAERRKAERLVDPTRFNKKLTIAEKAIRRPVDASLFENEASNFEDEEYDFSTFKSYNYGNSVKNGTTDTNLSQTMNNMSISDRNYKEISVKQDAYTLNLGTVN